MSADLLLHDPICSELISTLPRFEEPGSAPSLRKLNGYLALVTVVSSAIYLYLNLFTLTGTPFLLDGDQVYFWTYAFRVLHGERIYQDVFTMHPPGASLFYAALFALFGARIWVTNFVVLALGVALCWLCFRIANTFMQGEAALSATAMFLVAVYGKLLNGTHHWFSVLAVLGAVALVLSGSEMRRIAGAGVLLGVASFFTQTRGPFALLGICIFLLWDGRRNREPWPQLLRTQVLIVLCFFGALFLLCLPYIATTGIAKLWYFQITYVRTHYVTGLDASMGLPELPSWRRLPFVAQYLLIYLLLPIVYALSLYRCLRERNRRAISRNWRPVALLSLVGVCLLAEIAFNVNWLRVFVVSMPGIVLLSWVVLGAGKHRRYVLALLWAVVVGLAVPQTFARHTHRVLMTLPSGRTAVKPPAFEKLDWLVTHTKPEDRFFEAAWPNFYLPLHLRNPVFLDLLERSALTSPQYVALRIRQLEGSQTHYVLWAPRLDFPDLLNGGEQYHLGIFRDYLRSHYHRVRSFSDQDEVWERN